MNAAIWCHTNNRHFPTSHEAVNTVAACIWLVSMLDWLGEQVASANEETFLLFSQTLPTNDLGFVDNKSEGLELDIGNRTIVLKQSPGLLVSQRKTGTTGAVLWKITPLVANWLATSPTVLQDAQILAADSVVVELGCGISGLIGIVLAPMVKRYVLTDQAYVAKKVDENITANIVKSKRGNLATRRPIFVDLDWETDNASRQALGFDSDEEVDLLIACDCIYNEHLIRPLVQTMADVCHLRNEGSSKSTAVLIAQQLRSEEIFESFLDALLDVFSVWRMPDHVLPEPLHSTCGYTVHIAWLKES